MIFHAIGLVNNYMHEKNIKVFKKIDIQVAFAIQEVLKGRKAFLSSASLGSWSSSVKPHLTFEREFGILKVQRTRSERFSSRSQQDRENKLLHKLILLLSAHQLSIVNVGLTLSFSFLQCLREHS